jgi:hypothetical protein
MNLLRRFKYEIIIVLFFILIRVPDLGHDVFNTDVWKWKTRIYDFGSGVFTLDFPKTIQKYHPGVTLMWAGTAGVKVFNLYHEVVLGAPPADNTAEMIFGLHRVQKFMVVALIAVAVAFILYALRNLFGIRYAILAVMFMTLEPFYVALSRLIHLEGLMSTFMIASFVWLYYYLTLPQNKKRLYVAAIFTGLAILTKTSALYMLPFAGLMMFLWNLNGKFKLWQDIVPAIKNSLKMYLPFLLISLFVFVLLWPAMWAAPMQALSALSRGVFTIGVERGHEQIYFGREVLDPGWTFYFVVFGLKSSIYLLLGLIGYVFVFKKLQIDRRKFVFFVLIFAVMYLVQITLPSKKLDRYLLPSIMSLILVSTFFYDWLLKKINKVWGYYAAALFMPLILTLAILHPDYLSYYNPMFGGLKTGINILEPKWMIGQREVVDYFSKVKEAEGYEDFLEGENVEQIIQKKIPADRLVIGFPEKYYTQIWPFIKEIRAEAVILEIRGFAEVSDYFVYPVWQTERGRVEDYGLDYDGSVYKNGVRLYDVYRKPQISL